MTGGENIQARFNYGLPFEYHPHYKLWMRGNHKPRIYNTDEGIWRRIWLVPFTVRITDERCDPNLTEKLLKELPGILNWSLEGCRQWRESGLKPPEIVLAASKEYRAEQDQIGNFIEECCNTGNPEYEYKAAEVYKIYRKWCDESGERPKSQTYFGRDMKQRFDSKKKNTGAIYQGIEINETWRPTQYGYGD
jgi:putative DNA primase/helicase